MKEATLIYPHQLYTEHPAIEKDRIIYLIEEPLLLTEFPTHTQKLLLHRLTMQAYQQSLVTAGYTVCYLAIQSLQKTADVFTRLAADNIDTVHMVDTTDAWLEKRIAAAVTKHNFTLHRYESPLFFLSKADAIQRYTSSRKHLANFYKTLRIDLDILITDDKKPVGGNWSFDEENRKKVPKGLSLPTDIQPFENADVTAALAWLETVPANRYGEAQVWIPYTRAAALAWLQVFIAQRLHNFGTYEDALLTEHTRVFHSTLSPLINIGLLSPQEVVQEVLSHSHTHNIPLNNSEGFIRQMIGWREFMRAAYECEGSSMRSKNFWGHTRNLPDTFWTGETGILPLDIAIQNALRFGYSHHIERLMVLGNFMLLQETDPDEVYRWFMAMYVDAYDWVMVPNVYGMSQFADGGSFATKPYISGSNYIKKMSNYPTGDWEEIWTALYWHFIGKNTTFFLSNHRLSMMPRLLEKMAPEKKSQYQKLAQYYFSQ